MQTVICHRSVASLLHLPSSESTTMAPTLSQWVRVTFVLVLVNAYVVWAKVGKELPAECREFLYLGVPPMGLQHHSLCFICQHYNKKPRYVTLYNTADHIPIYSAYTFKPSDGEACVDVPWMYEPQVETQMELMLSLQVL